MNDKKFDSFIKKSLADHESAVPNEMWKRIQAEKDLDPFLKQTLDSHESAVPADMWSRIQKEKKKERRPMAWWWAAASIFLLVGSATAWYFLRAPLAQNNSKNFVKINKAPSANDVRDHNTIAKNAQSLPNTTASSQDVARKDTTNVSPTIIAASPIIEHKKGITDLAPINNSSTKKNVSSTPKSKLQSSKHKIDLQTAGNDLVKIATTNNLRRSNDVNSKTYFHNKSDRKNLSNNLASINNKENNPQNEGGTNEATNNQLDNHSLQSGNSVANNEKLLLLHQLIRSSFLKDKMMPKQLLNAYIKSTAIACPTLGKPARNDWYLEAFVSPDFVLKTLRDKPFGKNIQSGMDSTLHRQVSFSAGINIVKSLGENWLVKTGVQYAQINELFKYTKENEIRTTTVITVRSVLISPGDTVFIRDTSSVQTIGRITKQTQNHYRQWDVPLIFSYEFGGEDLRLNANFGVIGNIRSSYQGNMLDTLQNTIDISKYGNTGIYKTNIGLGVYLGLGILKPIANNMDLLIEPHARFNLGNMTTNAAIFNQKNTILGLSVGIRYKLNGKGQR